MSNAHMRYVADPLSEDPGVAPPPPDAANPGTAVASAPVPKGKGKKGVAAGKKNTNVAPVVEEEGGRPAILKVLREYIGEGWDALKLPIRGKISFGAIGAFAGTTAYAPLPLRQLWFRAGYFFVG